MPEYRPRNAIEQFAVEMEARMQEKDALVASGEWRGWIECRRSYLLMRLGECAQEALASDSVGPAEYQSKKLVDVANFAMMLQQRNVKGDAERGGR